MKKYKFIILFILSFLTVFLIFPELRFDVIALDKITDRPGVERAKNRPNDE